jgi:high-affinity iron transporter
MANSRLLGRVTRVVALAIGLLGAWRSPAQERPANRVATIVSVAVEEYRKSFDAQGQLTSEIEYEEAVSFLAVARDVAARLSGSRAEVTRSLLDSLSGLVAARRPLAEVTGLHERFAQSLGADAALELPTQPVDLSRGAALYARHCAECHGARGRGDGPRAAEMHPPPPALGDPVAMADVSPATMYRFIAVGVAGTPMAGWAGALNADDRWSIVAHLGSLRAPVVTAPGEGLFVQRCAACHGPSGAGDGPMASGLSKLPLELNAFTWQVERSDAQLAASIRDGVSGTSMPPHRDLSDGEVSQLVAHVRTLSLRDVPEIASVDSADGQVVATRVLGLVDDALAAARAGRRAEAADRALDAYLAFEPLETPGRAREPGRVAAMERVFAEFRGALRANDLRQAERSRNAIEAGLPGMVELTVPRTGFWSNFLQSLLIILREGLEAILVVGAVVAFLIKTGHRERLRAIWAGVILALGASAVTAVVLATVLRALPATREIIEGVTMLIAVAVLFSVSYWLVSKVEAARWQQFIRDRVNDALQHGGSTALAIVAFLAVYREGAETALFYQALFREGAGLPLTLGMLVGFVGLALVFVGVHRYGLRIPLRPFFASTSALLYLMAFVFMGKGIRELQEGGVVSLRVLPGWPHLDVLGVFPSVETLLAQGVLLLLLIVALLKTFWPRRSVALPTVPSTPTEPSGAVVQRLTQLEEKVAAMEEALHEGAERQNR